MAVQSTKSLHIFGALILFSLACWTIYQMRLFPDNLICPSKGSSFKNKVETTVDTPASDTKVLSQPVRKYYAKEVLVDPHSLYAECIGWQKVEHVWNACVDVFFNKSYHDIAALPTQTVSLGDLFAMPESELHDQGMLNLTAAMESVERDRVKPYRVITMTLYGTGTRYTRSFLRNAIIMATEDHFSSWVLRVYYDNTVPKQLTHMMSRLGVEMFLVQQNTNQVAGNTAGTFWRFLVMLDTRVTRYQVRDSDMKLTARDASAVNEWVSYEPPMFYHVQRDHQGHQGPILGGMWGAVGGFLDPHSRELFHSIPKDQILKGQITYGGDQTWLWDVVWPQVKKYTLAHDIYYCNRFVGKAHLGYPVQRTDLTDFVGNIYRQEENFRGLEISQYSPDPGCIRNASWPFG